MHCPFFDSTVLYCSWLFQLNCTVWLHCTTLYCLTMNSTRLHATARSFPFALYYCGVRSTTLHCTVIHWTVGSCAILHCNTAPFISVRWPAASSSSVTSEQTSTCAYTYSAQRLQSTTSTQLSDAQPNRNSLGLNQGPPPCKLYLWYSVLKIGLPMMCGRTKQYKLTSWEKRLLQLAVGFHVHGFRIHRRISFRVIIRSLSTRLAFCDKTFSFQ